MKKKYWNNGLWFLAGTFLGGWLLGIVMSGFSGGVRGVTSK